MTDNITLTGIVATDPRMVTTEAGLDITSFRLACTQRRFDRARDAWTDGDTNWYTVTAFRALAANVGASVHKGERIVVAGRLRIRPWETDDRSGTTVEVDADAVGHDLRWGRSDWRRTVATPTPAPTPESTGGAAGDASAAEDGPGAGETASGSDWSSPTWSRPDESPSADGPLGSVPGVPVPDGAPAGAAGADQPGGVDEPPF
jgi:single-strand DNA-binding protein